jgi:hypothetical protein
VRGRKRRRRRRRRRRKEPEIVTATKLTVSHHLKKERKNKPYTYQVANFAVSLKCLRRNVCDTENPVNLEEKKRKENEREKKTLKKLSAGVQIYKTERE